MKRWLLIVLTLLALPSVGKASDDPIGRLVARLSGSGGLWVNGVSPLLEYPASMDLDVLVSKILKGYDWASGQPFKMLERREVEIDGAKYKALLVDTAAGKKIILLQFQRDQSWWSKVMDP